MATLMHGLFLKLENFSKAWTHGCLQTLLLKAREFTNFELKRSCMKDFQTIFLIASKHANGCCELMNFQNIMQGMNSHASNDFKTQTQNEGTKG